MSDPEMLSSDPRSIVLKSHIDSDVELFIDGDGDLSIETNNGNDLIFIRRDQLDKLRDWLIEVVP